MRDYRYGDDEIKAGSGWLSGFKDMPTSKMLFTVSLFLFALSLLAFLAGVWTEADKMVATGGILAGFAGGLGFIGFFAWVAEYDW